MSGPLEFVTCEECGHEQADMGRNVKCEECGARMPRPARADRRPDEEPDEKKRVPRFG